MHTSSMLRTWSTGDRHDIHLYTGVLVISSLCSRHCCPYCRCHPQPKLPASGSLCLFSVFLEISGFCKWLSFWKFRIDCFLELQNSVLSESARGLDFSLQTAFVLLQSWGIEIGVSGPAHVFCLRCQMLPLQP